MTTATQRNLIYDIGMHKGEDTVYFLRKGFRVLAIEADPILVEQATKKFDKAIKEGRLTILNIGIGSGNGILPFYRNHRLTEWSSFDKDLGARKGTSYDVIEVKCTTLDTVIKEHGVPYYMKIDIEGFDQFCVESLDPSNAIPKYISCEASDIHLLNLLKEKGYSKFKIISQSNSYQPLNLSQEKSAVFYKGQIVKMGIKLRLQKFIPVRHLYGSSGPFAEDTKGPWLSYNEAKEIYHAFQFGKNGGSLNNISWFDFHATY